MDMLKAHKKRAGLMRKPALIQGEERSPEGNGGPPPAKEINLFPCEFQNPKSALHSTDFRANSAIRDGFTDIASQFLIFQPEIGN
jgi:hypothetical protein